MTKIEDNAMKAISVVRKSPKRYVTQEQLAKGLNLPLEEVRPAVLEAQRLVPQLYPGYAWESNPTLRITRKLSPEELANKCKMLHQVLNTLERTGIGLCAEGNETELRNAGQSLLRAATTGVVTKALQVIEDSLEEESESAA